MNPQNENENRAWLVGERTFGKSLIQHLFPLPDGGALKLTVAEYLTPKQVCNVYDMFIIKDDPRGPTRFYACILYICIYYIHRNPQ